MKKIINIIVDSAVPSCGKTALCNNLGLPDTHYFYEKPIEILDRLETWKHMLECAFLPIDEVLAGTLEQQINTEIYIMFSRAFKIIEKKAICPNSIFLHKRSIFSCRAYLDIFWDKHIVRQPYSSAHWNIKPNYENFRSLWKTMIDCLGFHSKNTMVIFLDKTEKEEEEEGEYKKSVLDLYETYHIQVLKYDTDAEINKIVEDIKKVKFE